MTDRQSFCTDCIYCSFSLETNRHLCGRGAQAYHHLVTGELRYSGKVDAEKERYGNPRGCGVNGRFFSARDIEPQWDGK